MVVARLVRRVWAPLIVLVVVGAMVLAGDELNTYATWGMFSWSAGTPPRFDWCGRRYYPAHRALSSGQVEAQLASVAPGGGLREIGGAPSGYAMTAAPMSGEQKGSSHTSVCAMVVYLRVKPDVYLPYALSGGP